MNERLTVCDTKILYDTEFEATVMAAKQHRANMVPYQCGRHWHLTHADLEKRRGFGGKHSRCPFCKQIYKRTKIMRHECAAKRALA